MIEKRGDNYRVVARWKGMSPIAVTVGDDRDTAERFEVMLRDLYNLGQHEILDAIAFNKVTIGRVAQACKKFGLATVSIEHLGVGDRDESDPAIGVVYDEWMTWMKSPGARSPRTKRPYSASTIERYEDSWLALFQKLPDGRATRLSGIDEEFIAGYENERAKAGATPGTLNRDWTAIQSLQRWIRTKKRGIRFALPERVKAMEPPEEARDIPPADLARIRQQLPAEWVDFFDTLVHTGMRIEELQGMLREDVDLAGGEVRLKDTPLRRLKTPKARRAVPLTTVSRRVFAGLLATPGRAKDPLWPSVLRDYQRAYRAFERACVAAGLHDEGESYRRLLAEKQARGEIVPERAWNRVKVKALYSPHRCRHTYGVTLIEAGVPITVVRDRMGHTSLVPTERYTRSRDDGRHHGIVRDALEARLGNLTGGNGSNPKGTPKRPKAAGRTAATTSSRTRSKLAEPKGSKGKRGAATSR